MTQPFSKLPLRKAQGLNLDINSWLRSLGLGQYEAAFRDRHRHRATAEGPKF
jgi:hypothetical protein